MGKIGRFGVARDLLRPFVVGAISHVGFGQSQMRIAGTYT